MSATLIDPVSLPPGWGGHMAGHPAAQGGAHASGAVAGMGAPARPSDVRAALGAAWGAAAPQRPRRGALLAIAALHGLVLWAFVQRDVVTRHVAQAVPLMVSIVAPQTQPAAPAPSLPAPAAPTPPRLQVEPPPPLPVQAPPPVAVVPEQTAPSPLPAPQPAPAPVAAAVAEPAPRTAAAAPAAAPAPAAEPAPTRSPAPAAAPAGPRMMPPSAVQYLVEPPVEYPRASRRLRETGRVMVRVLIGTGGQPEQVLLDKSSGFPLLDEAALAAARKARFRPYSENGVALAAWAVIPLSFSLDN